MKKTLIGVLLFSLAVLILVNAVYAHDGWVQTNVARVTVNDMVYVDMQFGNHGNMHRDYKIYGSKWDVTKSNFTLHTPDGEAIDLKDGVIDIGVDEVKTFAGGSITYTDKNGYLVTSFIASQKGVYTVDVRQDTVVSYAPERSIKCTKAIVGAIKSSMKSSTTLTGFDETFGQAIEIVPLKDPTRLAVGDELPFLVLFKGSPLPDAEVSVIPRGKVLPPMGTPNPNDFMADMDGMASFTFTEANYHLIVVHLETSESGTKDGKSYSMTKYTAALTVIVSPPQPKDQELSQPEESANNQGNGATAKPSLKTFSLVTLPSGQNTNSAHSAVVSLLAVFALAFSVAKKK